jgi:iron complex transport system substrate-binding protein
MILNPRVRLLIAALACFYGISCGISCDSKPQQTASTNPSTQRALTVASLAPAATDLIIGMGAGAHLVAVSNFDFDRPGQPKLPHVGDYQNTDWERLGDLRPSFIIVQMEADRVPAGFRDRAVGIGATIIDIQIENLADIGKTIDQLGVALNETGKATDARNRLMSRLEAVRKRVAAEAPVATFLTIDERGNASAGPGTFLDEILTIAGGRNVLAGTSTHWPAIDKERLISLSPEAVVELMPGASPQVLAQANDFWATLPQIPAVAHGRTYQITDQWALTPGIEVADLAEHLAALLHPKLMPATEATP